MHRERKMKRKTCPACQGTTRVPNLHGPDYLGDYIECAKCDGNGYIVETEVEWVPDEDDKREAE